MTTGVRAISPASGRVLELCLRMTRRRDIAELCSKHSYGRGATWSCLRGPQHRHLAAPDCRERSADLRAQSRHRVSESVTPIGRSRRRFPRGRRVRCCTEWSDENGALRSRLCRQVPGTSWFCRSGVRLHSHGKSPTCPGIAVGTCKAQAAPRPPSAAQAHGPEGLES